MQSLIILLKNQSKIRYRIFKLRYPPDGCTVPFMHGSYNPPCVEGIFIATGANCTVQCQTPWFTPSVTQARCPRNGGLLSYSCKRVQTAAEVFQPKPVTLKEERDTQYELTGHAAKKRDAKVHVK